MGPLFYGALVNAFAIAVGEKISASHGLYHVYPVDFSAAVGRLQLASDASHVFQSSSITSRLIGQGSLPAASAC